MIQRLSAIASNFDHFIIDIFGVIHDGIRPFPDTVHTLRTLKAEGKQICLLSNSPRLNNRVVQHMEDIGIPRSLYDHIVTSGEATHADLSRPQWHGKACWFIGKSFINDLSNLNLRFVDGPDTADFILNSIPGTGATEVEILTRQLKTAVAKNLPMICANPDLVVNIGTEQHECAGTFAALYEQLGGPVTYHGKPHAPVYETCHALLGHPDKSRIAAIGDSLHTDIAGANRFGVKGIWNLEGIHWEELTQNRAPSPEKIEALIARQPHKPDFIIKGFSW